MVLSTQGQSRLKYSDNINENNGQVLTTPFILDRFRKFNQRRKLICQYLSK